MLIPRRPRFFYSHSTLLAAAVGFCALSAGAGACASAQSALSQSADAKPSLVVFITVDQMRADYLDRFGAELTGGLKRLVTEGAVFRNGFHDHAITETAPGHAATMSGRFPVRTGIMMNSQGVNGVPDGQVLGGRADAGPYAPRWLEQLEQIPMQCG